MAPPTWRRRWASRTSTTPRTSASPASWTPHSAPESSTSQHYKSRAASADIIYRSEEGKYIAVVEEIEEMHAQGRPVLVGTVSIENSERLGGPPEGTSTCEL